MRRGWGGVGSSLLIISCSAARTKAAVGVLLWDWGVFIYLKSQEQQLVVGITCQLFSDQYKRSWWFVSLGGGKPGVFVLSVGICS